MIDQDKFFDGLGFERCEMEYMAYGAYVCFKGPDGFFYRIDHFGHWYVIEVAESEDEAKVHAFEDADTYDDSLPEEELIAQIQSDLRMYVAE